jgi:hypothetical protein
MLAAASIWRRWPEAAMGLGRPTTSRTNPAAPEGITET